MHTVIVIFLMLSVFNVFILSISFTLSTWIYLSTELVTVHSGIAFSMKDTYDQKIRHVNTFLVVPVRLGHQGEVDASAVGAVLLTFKFPSHLIQNIFLSLSMALLDLHLLTPKTNREKESEQISFEQPQLPHAIDPTSRTIKKQ